MIGFGSFNSRSREGSDEIVSITGLSEVFQFTLPRGERLDGNTIILALIGFNSRSREGSDSRPPPALASRSVFQFTLPRGERLKSWKSAIVTWKFQFTLPRGERRSWLARSSHRQGFNSRSREGSDLLEPRTERVILVSIHAPARGATKPYLSR